MQLVEVLYRHVRRVGQDHQPLADVAQLPDIARPGVAAQQLLGLWGELGNLLAKARRQDAELTFHQGNYVVWPLPQGRDGNFQSIEPVEEIAAEFPQGNLLPDVHIGGGNDPHVDGDDRRAADAADFLLLEDPQQLRLEGHGNLPNFIQEDGSPVGQLKKAHPPLPGRAGEGAGLIAEQLALQEVFRQRGAVDGHKGLGHPPAGGVDAVGEELLAGAGLPGDQHVGIRPAEFFGNFHLLPHLRVYGDDAAEGVLGGGALPDQALSNLALLLENLGGGAGGNQSAHAGVLAGDKLIADIVLLTANGYQLLLPVPAGLLSVSDEGQPGVQALDRASPPAGNEGQAVKLVGLIVGLQNMAGFIYCHHRVVAVVQDHADDVGFGPFRIDEPGGVQGLLDGPLQRGGPNVDVGAGEVLLPADVADGAAADNGSHAVPAAGLHRLIGALLVHHVIDFQLRPAELAEPWEHGLQPLVVDAQADFLRVEGLPALQQGGQNVRPVKAKVGNVLPRVQPAEHPVGDAPGDDDIVVVQVV